MGRYFPVVWVVQRCSVKKLFLKFSQTLAQVFPCEFWEIFKNTFLQNTSVGCLCHFSSIPCLIMANFYLDDYSWYPKILNSTNFFKIVAHTSVFLEEVSWMLQVDIIFLSFHDQSDIPCFTNAKKLWQIIDIVWRVKNSPDNIGFYIKKNGFGETYLMIS